MRKLLFALPLVAGASWAGTTYYAGSQTEPAYERLISQLNELKPYTIESEDYQAGFLQSVAVTKVLGSGVDNATVLFRLKHVINHSPLGIDDNGARLGTSTIKTTLLKEQNNQEALDFLASFEGQEPFELLTQVGINGDAVNQLNINAFALEVDGTKIAYEGGQFIAHSDANGSFVGEGSLGALQITADGEFLADMQSATATFDLQRHGLGIYTGTYQAIAPEFSMSFPATGVDVQIENVGLSSTTTIDQEVLAGNIRLQAGAIDAPLDIQSASYQFDFGGVGLSALERHIDIISNLPQSDDAGEEVLRAVNDAYAALLAPGTSLGTELTMTNSGGAIEGSITAGFKGDGTASGYDSLVTVRDLLMALDIQLQLNADVEAVNKTPLAMAMMHPAAGQFILSDGVVHSSTISVSDLIMDINGNPQSLDDMFGAALETPLDLSMLAPQ